MGTNALVLIVQFEPIRETPISIDFLLDRGENAEYEGDDYDDYKDARA